MPPANPQLAQPTTLRYQVDAVEVPIVYTGDGDHDRDGLVFALRAYRPLIEWLKERWEEDNELLPTLHERCQRIQIVVDGLDRYEKMRARLTKLGQDLDLLNELGGEAPAGGAGAAADEDHDAERHLSPTSRTRRQNYRALVGQLVDNLTRLTDGAVTALHPDAAVREVWRQTWAAGLEQAEAALEAWFIAMEADPKRRFDADALAAKAQADGDVDNVDSRLTPELIRRLMLNDHRTKLWPPAGNEPEAQPGPPDPHRYDRCNPMKPMDLIRPLVLRARAGDTVEVTLHNSLSNRHVGMHVQGGGLAGRSDGVVDLTPGVKGGDGGAVGTNDPSLASPGVDWRYVWHPVEEGVWPINDLGDVRGTEAGTNIHGLFGALIVEPPRTWWRDPETGEPLIGTDCADGLYVDIVPFDEDITDPRHHDFVDFHLGPDNQPGGTPIARSHREYAIFIHDEPEVHSALHFGEHTVMPLSYRAEPMENRLPHRMRRYAAATSAEPPPDQTTVDQNAVMWEIDDDLSEVFRVARTPDGRWLERVAGEEQHHSSWLFGDPVTPILRAYKGDPARIRLVHAGVKETHVYHLHVHQWRAVPQDTAERSVWGVDPASGETKHKGSQLLDSITIGPQTAVTIDPLYGAGSRQHLFGDVIWHCHLYPHFHHGMWGLWRSYDRLVDGNRALPDGTPTRRLRPLPGRDPEPPTAQQPGFPWFMDATFPQKSPPPPAIRPQDKVGRRQLLEMPLHSALEWEAFDPGCRANPHSAALFVDLDGLAAKWNAEVGLGPPRVISYDVEVIEEPTTYNSNGWHDLHGHRYQLTGVTTIELDGDGNEVETVHPLPPPGDDPEPFFPRANHGDIVEWRLHNRLASIRPDDYDLPTPPVECGLHVHLVKFDVLAADGSSTGFNYLSGASCPEAVGQAAPGQPARDVGLHRWVVDEEFGPCFFHDHLLANYRQKRGLFAALIAEPPKSQWTRPDQETIAWAGTEAVVWPGADTGEAPYREACLGIGDFIPLYDQEGKPLNAPGTLSSDEDPGSMGVNYRSTPLTHRGQDPSAWFSSASDGADPDTPIFETYAGERLRLRLIQGSHEEQHSFMVNGLRWHREWHNDRSPVVNQQTIGISEAFTLEIERHQETIGGHPHLLSYGPGDHLWSFTAIDDLWLGCWGLIRALAPGDDPDLPMLPGTAAPVPPARAVPPRPPEGDASIREYTVVAIREFHGYHGTNLTDPWGLLYRVQAVNGDNVDSIGDQPLVIRARPGEWVKLTLRNEVLPADDDDRSVLDPPFGPEPSPPPLPIEHKDELGRPDKRTVSPRVSLHPSLVRYDVVTDDGSWVGRNHDSTVASLGRPEDHGGHLEAGQVVFRSHHGGLGRGETNQRTYWWYVDHELGPASHTDGPGRVCYLHDLADIRNHRHHGLIGALVVEPGDCVPVDPETGEERWFGPTVNLVAAADFRAGRRKPVAHETVLLVQDGLRHFVAGNPALPVSDIVPGDDPEDAGQKGINYRVAMVHPDEMLHNGGPPTPIWTVKAGTPLWLRLVGAADKPRNHTFNVHGVSWSSAPWQDGGPRVGSLAGLTGGATHDLVFTASHSGDHAYRTGVFRWALENGLWGIIRVE